MDELAGLRTRWSRAPAVTVRIALADLPRYVAVTTWRPATVAVQGLPSRAQLPSAAIVSVVSVVTSPRELS